MEGGGRGGAAERVYGGAGGENLQNVRGFGFFEHYSVSWPEPLKNHGNAVSITVFRAPHAR